MDGGDSFERKDWFRTVELRRVFRAPPRAWLARWAFVFSSAREPLPSKLSTSEGVVERPSRAPGKAAPFRARLFTSPTDCGPLFEELKNYESEHIHLG